MDLLKAIVYGIIQGLTEFLPVSSNAHIRIVPALLHWEDPGAAFTAVIQLGTVLAVLIYFAKDLWSAFKGWAKSITGDKTTYDARVGWAVLYGTIPIIVIGLPLHSKVETTFRSLYFISFALIFMGVLMLIADRKGKQTKSIDSVQPVDGAKIGLWQCLALIPGMSRSGSTITGALFDGFDRASAARFSFLMSVPSIAGAGFYEAFKERKHLVGDLLMPTAVATVVSFIVGYAVIAWFIKFLQKKGIEVFVWYRIVLGIALLALVFSGTISPDAGAPADKSEASATK